jgi:hypothetical protein
MVPKLVTARSCIPPSEDNPDDPGHDALTVALDRIDGMLVACAQLLTRRGTSVFFDMVSYACWDVEPTTAHLTRRADLGRSYFDCQDGECTDDRQATSYDGSARVVVDDAAISIVTRPDGKPIAQFPRPADVVADGLLRGDLVYLGRLLYVHTETDHRSQIRVLDGRGQAVATLPGRGLQIVDDDLVLAITDALHATAFEPRTRITRQLAGNDCTADELAGRTDASTRCTAALATTHLTDAVRFRGKLYAVDQDRRRFVELDPATFRERKALPLATCP